MIFWRANWCNVCGRLKNGLRWHSIEWCFIGGFCLPICIHSRTHIDAVWQCSVWYSLFRAISPRAQNQFHIFQKPFHLIGLNHLVQFTCAHTLLMNDWIHCLDHLRVFNHIACIQCLCMYKFQELSISAFLLLALQIYSKLKCKLKRRKRKSMKVMTKQPIPWATKNNYNNNNKEEEIHSHQRIDRICNAIFVVCSWKNGLLI